MWGWFRALKPWQRDWLLSEALSSVMLLAVVMVFVGPADWRIPLLIAGGCIGAVAFLMDRRAWGELTEQHPKIQPPRWLRDEWPDDGRHLYLRFIGLRWLVGAGVRTTRDRLRVLIERWRSDSIR